MIKKKTLIEKIRHSFKYKGAEIEIDEWPLLEPYIEIECDNILIQNNYIVEKELTF